MPRVTKTSLRIQKFADKATKSSRKALLASLCNDMYNLYTKNGNRLPYGHISVILERLKPTEPWLTRNIINKAFLNYRKRNTPKVEETVHSAPQQLVVVTGKSMKNDNSTSMIDSEILELSNVSNFEGRSDGLKWNVGRPVGTTEEKKRRKCKEYNFCKEQSCKKVCFCSKVCKTKREKSKKR